jgi:hypothetical protein
VSIEAWINSCYPAGGEFAEYNVQNIVMCDFGATTTSTRTGWAIYNDYSEESSAPGDLTIKTYSGGSSTANPIAMAVSHAVYGNQWIHLVIVLTATNAVSYTNGVLSASNNVSTSYTYVPNDGQVWSGVGRSPSSFMIGSRGDGVDSYNWAGAVAETAYYTNVLQASDAAADYAARGNVATYEALVAARKPIIWYKMDEFTNQPVAKNYGTAGAAGNGYYPSPSVGVSNGVATTLTNSFPGFGLDSQAFNGGANGTGIASSGPGVPCGIGNMSAWDFTNSFTVTAWAQVTANNDTRQFVVSAGSNFWNLVYTSGRYPAFEYGANDVVGSSVIADDGDWHMWTGVYNSTNNAMALYIDGVQSGSTLTATLPSYAKTGGKTEELLIGGIQDWYGWNFVGNIAHVAIFPNALSSTQVASLFNTAAGFQPPVFVTPVFPNSFAQCWTDSTYVFKPVLNAYGATVTNVWSLDSGSGPVAFATNNGTTTPTLAFHSIPGLTAGNSYTLWLNISTAYGTASSSVELSIVAPPTVTQTIYSDTFARTGSLNGSSPAPTNLYSVAWSADSSFTVNGSAALSSSLYAFDAWLPFVPVAGHVYVLSCDLNPVDADANWIGLGFGTTQATALNTNNIETSVEARGNHAYLSTEGLILIPDYVSNPSGSEVAPYEASGVSTYQIELDTTTEPWTVTTLEDGIVQGSANQYGSDPSIESVVLENYSEPNGTFANFKLTDSSAGTGAPIMIENPAAALLAVQGFAVTMSGAAEGAPTITYQWQLNNQNVSNSSRITGAQSGTLSILSALTGDAGSYTLIAKNSSGSATSSPCVLTLVSGPVSLSTSDEGAWTTNETANATYSTPILANNLLTLTDSSGTEQGCTAFFNVPQYVGAFWAQFTYQAITNAGTAATGLGDGMTFCLQNDPRGPAAVGAQGSPGLYYGLRSSSAPVAPSVEMVFNLFSEQAATGYSWNENGAVTVPSTITPPHINIANGDPITVSLYYNGSSMTMTFTDPGPAATNSFTTNFTYYTWSAYSTDVGQLTSIVGDYAYVGFSGGQGGYGYAQQTITNFTFVSLPSLPKLNISVNGSGAAVVTWPGNFAGFQLQESANLATSSWVNVTSPMTINTNGNCQVTVPGGGSAFYRLVAP